MLCDPWSQVLKVDSEPPALSLLGPLDPGHHTIRKPRLPCSRGVHMVVFRPTIPVKVSACSQHQRPDM